MPTTGQLGTSDSYLSNIQLGGESLPIIPPPPIDLPTDAFITSHASAATLPERFSLVAVGAHDTDVVAEDHATLVEITNG